MRLLHIVAQLPPVRDGIGDYADRICRELSHTQSVTAVTSKNPEIENSDSYEIIKSFTVEETKSVLSIPELPILQTTDCVILQYNPFSFGKYGKNFNLAQMFKKIKSRYPKIKTATMFHERFYPTIETDSNQKILYTKLHRSLIFSSIHRWQYANLVKNSDYLLFSTETWVEAAKKQYPDKKISLIRIGSPAVFQPGEKSIARKNLGIAEDRTVIGLFGSLHVAKMVDVMNHSYAQLEKNGLKPIFLYVGADTEAFRERITGVDAILPGAIPADRLSEYFHAMDILLAPFIDGAATRRTSLIIGLQHGLPTVSTIGISTGNLFISENNKSICLVPNGDKEIFADAVLKLAQNKEIRESMGKSARRLYETHFDYPVLASELLSALEISP